jgi:hypothetical protein
MRLDCFLRERNRCPVHLQALMQLGKHLVVAHRGPPGTMEVSIVDSIAVLDGL